MTLSSAAKSHGLSVIAIVISLLAVAFTGLQWWESRSQRLLAMTPTIDFESADDVDDPPVGIRAF